MSQRYNFIHNFINTPSVYKIIQFLMSGTLIEKKIIKSRISKKKLKVLDIGCGPANVLNYLPKCEYYGYDIDKRSINYAKKKYNKKNFHFFCKRFNKNEIKKLPNFDFILLFGILHHLNDKQVNLIFNLCKKKMKKNSQLLTKDPILIKNQNIVAKYLINNDRGMNVRSRENYLRLIKKHFKNLQHRIIHQSFIPYTWFTTICKK